MEEYGDSEDWDDKPVCKIIVSGILLIRGRFTKRYADVVHESAKGVKRALEGVARRLPPVNFVLFPFSVSGKS